MVALKNHKAVFLDRDGVINSDRGYVSQWSEFEFLPGVVTAMAQLQALDYRLIIVTNQSGIGRGFYTEGEFAALSTQLIDFLADHDVSLTAIYHCPHHPTEALGGYRKDCDCRKPRPGMILRGLDDWQLVPEVCALVGDKLSDIEAGRGAGIGHLFRVATAAKQDGVTSVSGLPEVVQYLTAWNEAQSSESH
ncbi:MAG: HAD family hydrolase [Luminiphilus sp.]|nr:HAD family hydrolase [Luminiphilus sp.]